MTDELDNEIQSEKGIDLDLMKKIKGLIESGSSANKHEALNLIERKETRLSGYYTMKFFGSLNYDTDETVKTRARKVMDNKIGPEASKKLDISLEKFRVIQESFKHLSSGAIITSAAFDASHNFAKIMRDSLTVPISSITLNPVFEIVQSQQKMIDTLSIPPLILPQFSPILEITNLASRLAEVSNPNLTIPEALDKSIPELEKELDAVIDSDEDIVFNFEGYKILYNLERFLRDLIKQRICLKDPQLIPNRIPREILDDWKFKRDQEQKNPYVSGQYYLIDYSDFTDLKMIFEKGRNIKLFLDICSEEQFRAVISKMNELDPIRKKIAHSRPLRKEEFDRLKMYAEDIDNLLNRPSKS